MIYYTCDIGKKQKKLKNIKPKNTLPTIKTDIRSNVEFLQEAENELKILNISLCEEDGTTLKSVYQLLKEIAQEWERRFYDGL